uniref:non-reducing end alpha-L-arabinofuranosidase n=1 Tax=Kalanchoe fedtschenkoi TaxID=63787 RepID=A0A7N0VEA3_KALFE
MGRSRNVSCMAVVAHIIIFCCSASVSHCRSVVEPADAAPDNASTLRVNTSGGRKIPETLFGIFFEEINHAGAGGLWAELVSNRGFEAGSIEPWAVIGDSSSVAISTDDTSCFERNKIALKVDVLCDGCPGGVGVYNPGFWGMNIEQGNKYKLIFYVRSSSPANVTASLTDASGRTTLATVTILSGAANWTRQEIWLQAGGTSDSARLQLTANTKATLWFDQVSLMPQHTFKGHGFRNDLAEMLVALKPAFLRFPGGCYVEGGVLKNAFMWKNTVGPSEERPGHFGDVWNYWTDDGFGYLEFLQLAEDLGAAPIWVFNSGVSLNESVDPEHIQPYVQDALDGLEFANGPASSKWGSLRAKMGHPAPFDIRCVAIGNEDCTLPHYQENYPTFYNAIKKAYPAVKVISNCDGSASPLPHPADFYDYHTYAPAADFFKHAHLFDQAPRLGPKAFVSEYAVTGSDANNGSLLAALGEAAFLIGIENNSDLVELASYAPLFTNVNDRRWNPDAIPFNSSHSYGTPSYYMQQFFIQSNGATLLNSTLETTAPNLIASAITWNDSKSEFLRVKVVNFDNNAVNLTIVLEGTNSSVQWQVTAKTEMTSANVMDENSLDNPSMIVPVKNVIQKPPGQDDLQIIISPHSITSSDFKRIAEEEDNSPFFHADFYN